MRFEGKQVAKDSGVGLIVGVFSGLFGVGGGIILVPLLVLFFHVEQKRAQATSLVVVALAAVTGALTYAHAGSVVWESAALLLAGGLVGTWLGSALAVRMATRWLQLGFGLLLVATAVRLALSHGEAAASQVVSLDPLVMVGYVSTGFLMGLLSSLVGIGGGIVAIPLLMTFFGFTHQLAAGTTLVVIVPIALVGAWRLGRTGYTQWGQGIRIGVVAAVGAVAGASLALVLDAAVMQILFGVVLIGAAAQMIGKAVRGSSGDSGRSAASS